MHPDAPYFIILLCLTADNFTHQGESAGAQWVNYIDTWADSLINHWAQACVKLSDVGQNKIIKHDAFGSNTS